MHKLAVAMRNNAGEYRSQEIQNFFESKKFAIIEAPLVSAELSNQLDHVNRQNCHDRAQTIFVQGGNGKR
jgi:hypothetical protein